MKDSNEKFNNAMRRKYKKKKRNKRYDLHSIAICV